MKVIFRKFNKPVEIIALFPDIMGKDYKIMAYMHMGQHTETDYNYILRKTKLANETEYTPLLNELKSIGYTDLEICKKAKINYNK